MLNSDNITPYIVTVCKLSSNETRSHNQGGFQSQIHRESTRSLPSERRFVPQIRHVFWGHAMPCYHCKASQLKGFRQPCGCETNTTPTFILPRRCVGVRWGNKNDWTSRESCMKQNHPLNRWLFHWPSGDDSLLVLCAVVQGGDVQNGDRLCQSLRGWIPVQKKCSMPGQKLIWTYSLEV